MLFYYSFAIFHSLYFRNSEYHVSILKNLTKLSLLFKVCFFYCAQMLILSTQLSMLILSIQLTAARRCLYCRYDCRCLYCRYNWLLRADAYTVDTTDDAYTVDTTDCLYSFVAKIKVLIMKFISTAVGKPVEIFLNNNNNNNKTLT